MVKMYNDLFAALAKAQAEYNYAEKASANPFFKSKYAGIEELIKATRPALTKHGLSVIQEPIWRDGILFLQTVLGHSSGQYRESLWPINPAKTDIQSLGSYMTYVSRYAYRLVTGVVTGDEDDDGEIVMNRSMPQPRQSESLTQEQLDVLEFELHGHPDIARTMMDSLKVTSLSQIKNEKFTSIIGRIQQIKKNKASID
jgi:hypothetical protein